MIFFSNKKLYIYIFSHLKKNPTIPYEKKMTKVWLKTSSETIHSWDWKEAVHLQLVRAVKEDVESRDVLIPLTSFVTDINLERIHLFLKHRHHNHNHNDQFNNNNNIYLNWPISSPDWSHSILQAWDRLWLQSFTVCELLALMETANYLGIPLLLSLTMVAITLKLHNCSERNVYDELK